EIPIKAVIADQQASLYASFAQLKCTIGTGSFVDLRTGDKPYASRRKLYPLVAWCIKEEKEEVNEEGQTIKKIQQKPVYLLEGMNHNAGNIIDWMQYELNFYSDPNETEKMALSLKDSGGVYILPTFTSGLSFPYWSSTTGNIFGLNLETKKEHLVRAVLEGICYRIKDIVEGILKDTKIKINKIVLDGGVSKNKFILQFLSDILGMDVEHSGNPETTALGAAFMAGIETGFWKSEEELNQIRKIDQIFKPQLTKEEREKKYQKWKDIVSRSLNYY
ncbi:MAG: FGGY-family carbohydrate kinase, partial [Promethearchaeota archaeon]